MSRPFHRTLPLRAACAGLSALAVLVSQSSALGSPPPGADGDGDASTAADTVPESAPSDGSIVLVTGSLPWGASAEDLRSRISKELGAPVVLGSAAGRAPRGTLFLDSEGDQLTARFQAEDGAVTERTITLPSENARAMDTIVLVSGNVARDEAADIRAALRRRKAAGRPVPPAAPDPTPPAAPDPTPTARRSSPSSSPPGTGARAHGTAAPDVRNTLCDIDDTQPFYWAGVDFVPMLGTSLAERGAILPASLNVVGGLAGGIRGVQIGSAFNVVTGSVCGVQIGGAVNVAWEGARGVQISGAVNGAGVVDGIQIGGGVNIGGSLRGAQIAGGLNVAKDATGMQIAGGLNVAKDAVGLQIAGGLNVARTMMGVQIAPLNLSLGDVSGVQLGTVNVAGKVRGLQVGVINVAEESDFSLGVVSVVRKGRLHLDLWGAETGLFMAALKHGGRYFHNVYGVGIRPLDGHTRVAFSLGIGGHVPLGSMFFLDLDGLAYSVHRTDDFAASTALIAQARSMVGFRPARGFAVMAGPTYNVSFAGSREDAALSALGSSAVAQSKSLFVYSWPGVSVGVEAF